MLHAPTRIRQLPQPPADWVDRFSRRLARVHPGADPEQNLNLAVQLWAADDLPPEAAADIVASLLPDDDPES